MSDLEPCPNCGLTAHLCDVIEDDRPCYWVVCGKCEMQGPAIKTIDGAKLSWNMLSQAAQGYEKMKQERDTYEELYIQLTRNHGGSLRRLTESLQEEERLRGNLSAMYEILERVLDADVICPACGGKDKHHDACDIWEAQRLKEQA